MCLLWSFSKSSGAGRGSTIHNHLFAVVCLTFLFVELHSKATIVISEILKSCDVNDWGNQNQYANKIVQIFLDWIMNANISKSQISKKIKITYSR